MLRGRFDSFWLIWLIGALGAAALFYNFHYERDFLGIVETRLHYLAPLEGGRVAWIDVAVGDKVTKDRILATLDMSDLTRRKKRLYEELDNLKQAASFDRIRFNLEINRMQAQLQNDRASMMEKRALLASKRAELETIEAQVNRLESAEAAGLGHSGNLTELLRRRNGLREYVRELRNSLGRPLRITESETADIPSDTHDSFSEHTQRLFEIQNELALIEYRIQARSIIAPADGKIVEVNAGVGDSIDAFLPVLTIQEESGKFVDVFIPETADIKLTLGHRAIVSSRRESGYSSEAVIEFVYPGFTPIPERLAFRNQIYWVRKARVALENPHRFLPGEAVYIRFKKDAMLPDAIGAQIDNPKENPKPENKPHAKQTVTPIIVPPILQARSHIEPSGILWQPRLERYLIISDDTGYGSFEHAPWLFTMDEKGTLDAKELIVSNIDKFNDIEAITELSNDKIVLVSSQNISRHGKRPKSRQQLILAKWQEKKLHVIKAFPLLNRLAKHHSAEALKALGLERLEKDGLPTLNIEAAAFRKGVLYFGLKAPYQKGAIIWKLEGGEALLERGDLSKGKLSRFQTLQVPKDNGFHRGFSDMAFDEKGKLFALFTTPKLSATSMTSLFAQVEGIDSETPKIHVIKEFKGRKAEGLCRSHAGGWMIVFDADDKTPAFFHLPKGELE